MADGGNSSGSGSGGGGGGGRLLETLVILAVLALAGWFVVTRLGPTRRGAAPVGGRRARGTPPGPTGADPAPLADKPAAAGSQPAAPPVVAGQASAVATAGALGGVGNPLGRAVKVGRAPAPTPPPPPAPTPPPAPVAVPAGAVRVAPSATPVTVNSAGAPATLFAKSYAKVGNPTALAPPAITVATQAIKAPPPPPAPVVLTKTATVKPATSTLFASRPLSTTAPRLALTR